MTSKILNLSIFVLYLVATLILTYPVVAHLSNSVPNTGDPLLNAWILSWDVHAIIQVPTQLFNANIFYPSSHVLAYSEHLLGSALLASPILLLFHNPILAYNFVFLFSFVVSGYAMYLLVFHLTQNRWASVLSGFIFAFCPFRFAHVSHLQLLTTQWMPLTFLFFERFVRERRWSDWLFFILFFNLQVLSGWYYGLFLALATGLFFILVWVTGDLKPRQMILPLILFLVIGGAVNFPLAWPYFQTAREMNFVRNLNEVAMGSARLIDYISVPPYNSLFGKLAAAWRSPQWSEHSLFPGSVAALLSIYGIIVIAFRKSWLTTRVSLRYLWLFFFSFVLSLGTSIVINGREWSLPWRLFYQYIPGFQGLRVPARMAVIVILALSVLAGYGFSALVKGFGTVLQPRRSGLQPALAGALIIIMAAEYFSLPLPLTSVPSGNHIPDVYKWLQARDQKSVILELPLPSALPTAGYLEGPRLYYSAYHWHSLVNGYSGFFPPTYLTLMQVMSGFPNSESIAWLEALDVDFILLHQNQYSAEAWSALTERFTHWSEWLRPVGQFQEVLVYEILHRETALASHSFQEYFVAGGEIHLLSYNLPVEEVRPGETLPLILFWQRQGALIPQDYTVFVHLVDESGHLWAQHDGPPQGGGWPTSTWPKQEIVADVHMIEVPADLPPGTYELRVGFYLLSTMERLPVFTGPGIQTGDYITLAWIKSVKPALTD